MVMVKVEEMKIGEWYIVKRFPVPSFSSFRVREITTSLCYVFVNEKSKSVVQVKAITITEYQDAKDALVETVAYEPKRSYLYGETKGHTITHIPVPSEDETARMLFDRMNKEIEAYAAAYAAKKPE